MVKINELKQGQIEAAAAVQVSKDALNALLDAQAGAKKNYSALLKQTANPAPDATADERKALATKLADAEAHVEGFDSRLSAQRKLVAAAERDAGAADAALAAETERLAIEDKALAAKPSGRIPKVEVLDPEKFGTLGEQLMAVYKSGLDGAMPDNRLMASAGLNSEAPSDGGYLVQQEFSSTIWEKTYNVGELIQRAFRIPLTNPSSNGIKIPAVSESSRADGSRYGGVQVYWTEQGGPKTASKPAFRQMDLKLKKVAGIVYATDELLADAGALEAFINRALPTELRFAVEDAFVNGTGAGQPLGYMNSGAVVSVTRAGAGAVTYEDVVAMWSRMWAPSRSGAVWLVSQDVEPQLYAMSLAVGTGGAPVYLPAGGASATPFANLFGRPVIASEYTAALGTAGDIQLVDMGQYFYIEKGGVKADSSMHVRFLYDEMTFRFVYRVDGQPAWNTALTPKNGSATLSPFVVLGAA